MDFIFKIQCASGGNGCPQRRRQSVPGLAIGVAPRLHRTFCPVFGGLSRCRTQPGEPHQIINDGAADLVCYIVADNPIGETCHYPDSNKWRVRSPQGAMIRSVPLDYLDGEE